MPQAAARPERPPRSPQAAGPVQRTAPQAVGHPGARAGGAAAVPPPSAALQGLAGLVRASPQAVAQRAVRGLIDDSPGQAAGRRTAAAIRGDSPAALPAPLQAKMEGAFGVDFSAVRIHQGPQAEALGARAYTQGTDIHFAPGEYAPQHASGQALLGHELAHVVQQAAGRVTATTQAKGLALNDSSALEREADAAGARAARGEPVSMPGAGSGHGLAVLQAKVTGAPVQLSPKATHYGTFTDEKYDLGATALDIVVKFTPNDKVVAPKIGLTQSIRSYAGGVNVALDPAKAARMPASGHLIDRLSERNNPIYGADSLATGDGLDKTAQDNNTTTDATELNPDRGVNATYQLGHRIKTGSTWDVKDAGLYDGPSLEGGNNAGKLFETAALVLEGPQAGTWLGSVSWGWQRDGSGTITKNSFALVSMGTPSKDLLGAATAWNAAKTRGSLSPKVNGTSVVDGSGTAAFTLDTADTCSQTATVSIGGVKYIGLKVTSAGPNKDKTGYGKVSDFKDNGDGGDTVNLPVQAVQVLSKDNPIYEDSLQAKRLKSLPKGTRVKGLVVKGVLTQVEIVDGPDTGTTGWVATAALKAE